MTIIVTHITRHGLVGKSVVAEADLATFEDAHTVLAIDYYTPFGG